MLWFWGGGGIFLLGCWIYRKLFLRSVYDKKVKKEEAEQALSAAYLEYQKAYADYLEAQKTLPESVSQTREQ